MALYLKQLEDRKSEQEKIHQWDGGGSDQQLHHAMCPHQLQQQQMYQQHQDQHPSPNDQLFPETPLPCSICQLGENFNDLHLHPHLDTHHLQPLPSRSRHSPGRETPAGTPAVLCSLTLNVCEPFLSPETLPKAALPFRSPTAREGGHHSIMNQTQPVRESVDGHTPSAFVDGISAETPRADVYQAQSKMHPITHNLDHDFTLQKVCSPEERFGHPNIYDKSRARECHPETVMELQQIGSNVINSGERDQIVFQTQCKKLQPSTTNPKSFLVDDESGMAEGEVVSNSCPISEPSIVLATSSPRLYSRSASSDQVLASSGRNQLRRQLSLHTERSPSSQRHTGISGLQKEGIEEEDLKPSRFSDSDNSVACDSVKSSKSSADTNTLMSPKDLESRNRRNEEEEHSEKQPHHLADRPSQNPPANPDDISPLGPMTVSHSDPVLPHQAPQSPQTLSANASTSKPQDARPKTYGSTGGSHSGGIGERLPNNSTTSPDQGRGKLRRTILEAWRDNSPQTVDVPEISQFQKAVPSSTSFPAFLKTKGQQAPQEPARSTFPRAPGSRDERRGALFLSQKSLLHASGAAPKSSGGPRTASQPRVGSGHRGFLPRQVSVDSSSRLYPDHRVSSNIPLLDPAIEDPLQSSYQDAFSEDDPGPASPPGNHREPQSRIPKLSRAMTVDTSSLLEK